MNQTANMKPSRTMRVQFSNGQVVMMNRKERRRNHLYGDRLTIMKGQPSPPIFTALKRRIKL